MHYYKPNVVQYSHVKYTVTITLLSLLVVLLGSNQCAAQPSELTSSDGSYTVRIVNRALPHADRIMGGGTLILSRRGQTILKVSTTGYLINALWSPDSMYVAVNNRRGNSGDYVWVFALVDARSVKKPDDKSFDFPFRRISNICLECDEAGFDKDLMVAKRWRSPTELEIETRWRFYQTALIVRHSVYRLGKHTVTLVEEQFSRHPVDWQPPE